MRTRTSLLAIYLVCVAAISSFAQGKIVKTPPADTVKPPTKEDILALVSTYIQKHEPKLDFKDKQIIQDIKTKLFMSKGLKSETDKAVDGLVNCLTLKLASGKNLNALTVASAMLVQARPGSPRTSNLFASVLHAYDKLDDSITVLRYTLSLTPESQLAKLNLANAYMDAKMWEKAKTLADGVVKESPDCRPAHKILAYYWYNKNMLGLFRDELLKAAQFKGFVKEKTKKKRQRFAKAEEMPEETIEQTEAKFDQLKDLEPTTTAEIIEEEFPNEAKRIRDRYGKLAFDEQFILPLLPQSNTNGPENYRRSQPILQAWVQVFISRSKNVGLQQAAEMGIDPKLLQQAGSGTKAQRDAARKALQPQIKKAKEEELRKALQQAQDAIKWMQGADLPGMNSKERAKVIEAQKKLQALARKENVKLEDKPVETDQAPGSDKGGRLVRSNYAEYSEAVRVAEKYFNDYFMDYRAKVADIYKVYGGKIQEENDHHDEEVKRLMEEHQTNNTVHGGDDDIPCRREELRHKKALNAIGKDYYQQWAGLYMPQYTQKMKPRLDSYYATAMLYVKNMNDPEVMRREYDRVKRNHMAWATTAAGHLTDGGGFAYVGETYEEEQAIERDIAAAREEAERKERQFEGEFKEPEFDLSKWLEDHLFFEASVEFLSLRITAHGIEFEAWFFGGEAGVKYDWSENTLESYTGIGAKWRFGINVMGVEVGTEARVDFIRRVARWDFEKGTYEESNESRGEARAGLGFKGGQNEMSLNAAIEAKIISKVSSPDTYTIQ